MPVPMRATVVLVILALSATAPAARGSLVIVPFAGPITSVSSDPGPLPGFAVGEPVSGSLSYDPAIVTAVLSQPVPGLVFYRLPIHLEVTVSGTTRFSGPVDALARVQDQAPPAGDVFSVQQFSSTPPFLLQLVDRTGTALTSSDLPGALDPTAFSFRFFSFGERINGQGRSFQLLFGPDASSIPAPEPPTSGLALAGLALAGGWAAGRRWWRARQDRGRSCP